MLQNIASNIIRLHGLVIPLDIKFDQFRDKVENDLQMQRNSIDSLKHSISNLSTCLQEHKQQTQTEMTSFMTSLKTSLNSTQASIDNLTTYLQQHKQQTQTEIMNLQISFNSHQAEHTHQLNNKLDAINSTLNSQIDQSVINLTTHLQEHRQQTQTEMTFLKTSLNSTQASIDNLTTCLQEHKQQTATGMTSIKTSLNSTQVSIDNLTMCLQEHKQQTHIKIMNFQNSFNSHQAEHTRQLNNKLDAINLTLNSQIDQSVNSLTTCLQEHRQQTQTEMTSLKTSLNSTQASIDNLTCLQEHKEQTQTEMNSLKTSLNYTQVSIDYLTTCLQEHKQQTQTEMTSLKTSLNFTHASIDNLNTCLQEHKQQTATELSHLQTSVTSTHSKLDTLTNTTASDHQQIKDSMPDVECMDTQQTVQLHRNLQDNLTNQLETIKDYLNCPSEYTCGGTGGWRRVVYLNMTDRHTTCPSGWQLTGYSKRTCGRVSTGDNICDSAILPVCGGQYNKICGRITAYQYGGPDAFFNRGRSIDQAYACGVSVTHGTPRNHIWTFAAGTSEGTVSFGRNYACPCDGGFNIVPQFVANDYFCESGINEPYIDNRHRIFHPNDPLWDGEDCLPSSTCCSLHNPPYFVNQLPTSTTDDIEARICVDDGIQYANIAVELVELYVQ